MGKRTRGAGSAPPDVAARCARRCVAIIAGLLRPEEIGEAVREFHAAIAEELGCADERGLDAGPARTLSRFGKL